MKRTLLKCITAVIVIMALTTSLCALSPIDVDRECALTLCYGCEGIEINTYKIAGFERDGGITLCKEFEGYPINVYGVTDRAEWDDITSTLATYIVKDGLAPTVTAKTDKGGHARFDGLRAGLYLTLSVTVKSEKETKVFEDFITAIPFSDGGEYQYDVTAYPKHSSFAPNTSEREYRVLKQWSDNGYGERRPPYIEVEIYKDGVLYSTERLDSENNWCYSWKAADDGSKWRTVEKAAPDGYTVTVSERGDTFIITNAYQSAPPDNPPDTGDMINPTLWTAVMLVSGMLMILISLAIKRTAG